MIYSHTGRYKRYSVTCVHTPDWMVAFFPDHWVFVSECLIPSEPLHRFEIKIKKNPGANPEL